MDDNQLLQEESSQRSKPNNRHKGLLDPEEAAEYLKVVMGEGDKKYIAIAIRNIAEANKINLYSSGGEP